MRTTLTFDVIDKLARRKGAKQIVVENFLMSLLADNSFDEAKAELDCAAWVHKWNAATRKAILDGLKIAYGM
jgi:hypothetical protein